MMTNEENPKTTIRLKSLKKVLIKTLIVTSLAEPTCSVAVSIITVPIKGNIKNTIPKIGVTWCDVTVTDINDKHVK
ncbi:hypothetical protein GCM10022397_14140 [Flavivirga jejuensis]